MSEPDGFRPVRGPDRAPRRRSGAARRPCVDGPGPPRGRDAGALGSRPLDGHGRAGLARDRGARGRGRRRATARSSSRSCSRRSAVTWPPRPSSRRSSRSRCSAGSATSGRSTGRSRGTCAPASRGAGTRPRSRPSTPTGSGRSAGGRIPWRGGRSRTSRSWSRPTPTVRRSSASTSTGWAGRRPSPRWTSPGRSPGSSSSARPPGGSVAPTSSTPCSTSARPSTVVGDARRRVTRARSSRSSTRRSGCSSAGRSGRSKR